MESVDGVVNHTSEYSEQFSSNASSAKALVEAVQADFSVQEMSSEVEVVKRVVQNIELEHLEEKRMEEQEEFEAISEEEKSEEKEGSIASVGLDSGVLDDDSPPEADGYGENSSEGDRPEFLQDNGTTASSEGNEQSEEIFRNPVAAVVPMPVHHSMEDLKVPRVLEDYEIPDWASNQKPVESVGDMVWKASIDEAVRSMFFCEICMWSSRSEEGVRDHFASAHSKVEAALRRHKVLSKEEARRENKAQIRLRPHDQAPKTISRNWLAKKVEDAENIWVGSAAEDWGKAMYYCTACFHFASSSLKNTRKHANLRCGEVKATKIRMQPPREPPRPSSAASEVTGVEIQGKILRRRPPSEAPKEKEKEPRKPATQTNIYLGLPNSCFVLEKQDGVDAYRCRECSKVICSVQAARYHYRRYHVSHPALEAQNVGSEMLPTLRIGLLNVNQTGSVWTTKINGEIVKVIPRSASQMMRGVKRKRTESPNKSPKRVLRTGGSTSSNNDGQSSESGDSEVSGKAVGRICGLGSKRRRSDMSGCLTSRHDLAGPGDDVEVVIIDSSPEKPPSKSAYAVGSRQELHNPGAKPGVKKRSLEFNNGVVKTRSGKKRGRKRRKHSHKTTSSEKETRLSSMEKTPQKTDQTASAVGVASSSRHGSTAPGIPSPDVWVHSVTLGEVGVSVRREQ